MCLLLVQEDGEVEWSQIDVQLTRPSLDQCKEVISELGDNHKTITFNHSSSDRIQFLIPAILGRNTIEQFHLLSSFLSRDCILSFSSQLSTNKSLTILALTNGSISDDGVIALAQSLQYNETLKNLYLSYNPGITSACAQSLAELLLINSTLSDLNLSHTNIDGDGVLILMRSLKTNNTLKKLSLDKQHKKTCSTLPYYEDIENILKFVVRKKLI